MRQREWGDADKALVFAIRQKNPTYGKAKITVIIQRDYQQKLSESTVGRILGYLMKHRLIERSPSAVQNKRKRDFSKGHAKPWTYKKYKNIVLGERVQVDHMTVTKDGVTVKHFQAWDRRSRHLSGQVYCDATSQSAKCFLYDFLEQWPV